MSISITTRGMFSGTSIGIATAGKFKGLRILKGVKTFISKSLKYFIISKNTGDQ